MQTDLAAMYLNTDTKPNGFVISGLGPLNRWRHQLELTLKGKNRCHILSYNPMILSKSMIEWLVSCSLVLYG